MTKSERKISFKIRVTAKNFNSTSNLMFNSEFESFEVSILIEYLIGPYRTS